MNDGALFLAVFLACIVEAVEATTIVLAAGTARHWRSAMMGVAAGVIVLAVAVAIAGPAISLLPLGILRLVVGGLLLVFGLQWMRKAILRASGYKPLHDEEAIYRKQVAAAEAAGKQARFGIRDWYAFTLSFKGVVLEGLEVVFIVLTFGTNQKNIPLAALAAALAVVIVVVVGIAVRAPLARVPENTLKFVVGIMLTSFGVFWGVEGAGGEWPGADASLLVLAPALAVFALLLVALMRRARRAKAAKTASVGPVTGDSGGGQAATAAGSAAAGSAPASSTSAASATAAVGAPSGSSSVLSAAVPAPAATSAVQQQLQSAALRRLKAFGLFWYDFVIGDDWQIAAGVLVAFALVFALSGISPLSWIVGPIAVVVLLPYGIRRALR